MGLGLKGSLAASLTLTCFACSAFPARQAARTLDEVPRGPEPSVEQPGAVTSAAGELAFPKSQLFLVQSSKAELVLRASGSAFERRLASNAQHVLYDPAFELVWFSDARRLWLIDLRDPAPSAMVPVLIASDVPQHVELHVDRGGTDFLEPQDACDLAPVLQLHWVEEPWIEGEGGQRYTRLDGREWLQRERSRVARAPGDERWFHPSDPHVALPSARAHCEDAERCGAALPFVPAGWELVLTDQSEGADCWHFGCLLRDSVSGAFGTPPQPSRWGSPEGMPSGPCGPYRFNADGSAFLVKDVVCTVADGCQPLAGWGMGWLSPGPILGAAG